VAIIGALLALAISTSAHADETIFFQDDAHLLSDAQDNELNDMLVAWNTKTRGRIRTPRHSPRSASC
jgi:hypothetical protein